MVLHGEEIHDHNEEHEHDLTFAAVALAALAVLLSIIAIVVSVHKRIAQPITSSSRTADDVAVSVTEKQEARVGP